MKNEIEAMITDITTTTAEAEDYTGEDGLLYCGKCHTPKEAYFSKETAQWLGHDRHPTDCDCQRAAREKQQAAESRQKHLETVEDLKRRGLCRPPLCGTGHLSMTTAETHRPKPPAFMWRAGKPCRLKISATCFGGGVGDRKKLPCRLYRQRPYGKRGCRSHDKLCNDTQ